MGELQSQAASLAADRAERTAPDLATVAQATYTELIGKFSNPLLSNDSTIAAEKQKMEDVYLQLSQTFQEMARYNALLDAAAESAAKAAATAAAESTPPEEASHPAEAAGGVLAITTELRPATGTARDSPYSARTVVARARVPQSASSDPANAAPATHAAATQPAAKPKPPRERSEAELLASVSKLHRSTPATDMDQ